MTLFLHETHRLIGKREEEFEAAFRDPGGWMNLLGLDMDARLMWFAAPGARHRTGVPGRDRDGDRRRRGVGATGATYARG